MTKRQIVLLNQQSGGFVDAELIDRIDAAFAKRAEDSWQTFLAAAKVEALRTKRLFPEVDHDHWKWAEKVRLTEHLLPYPTLGIECDGQVQGLMLVETDGHFGRIGLQLGTPLVYVNLLATAPWNLPGVVEQPLYRGVGTVMLAAAVSMSVDLGFKGRLGLHSLRKSQGWYERLGMICLGADPTKQNLKYYELTPEQAQELIQ